MADCKVVEFLQFPFFCRIRRRDDAVGGIGWLLIRLHVACHFAPLTCRGFLLLLKLSASPSSDGPKFLAPTVSAPFFSAAVMNDIGREKKEGKADGLVCQVRGQRLQVRLSREIFIPTALLGRPIFRIERVARL